MLEFNGVALAKSEEIAKLLNFLGADYAKINLLLEEYLMNDVDISDNSAESSERLWKKS